MKLKTFFVVFKGLSFGVKKLKINKKWCTQALTFFKVFCLFQWSGNYAFFRHIQKPGK